MSFRNNFLFVEKFDDGTKGNYIEAEDMTLGDLIELAFEIICEIQDRVNGI